MSNPWDAKEYDATFGFVTHYGNDLLQLLPVEPGDRVLDLGCGTGHHAAALAQRGVQVVGLDADAAMLKRARAEHQGVTFVEADATAFTLDDVQADEPFDACFSNAALHWMRPQERVLANVRSVLADGAPFVAEMGGAGNIAGMDAALRAALEDCGLAGIGVPANYFPTVGMQSTLLEAAGFRVDLMRWFERPTPLAEGTTAADWTKHFRAMVWREVPPALAVELADRVDRHAAAGGLLTDSGWFADYCRLRFVATAV